MVFRLRGDRKLRGQGYVLSLRSLFYTSRDTRDDLKWVSCVTARTDRTLSPTWSIKL